VIAKTRLTQAGAVSRHQRLDLGRHLFAARDGEEIV
jgi:hypothetical protein